MGWRIYKYAGSRKEINRKLKQFLAVKEKKKERQRE